MFFGLLSLPGLVVVVAVFFMIVRQNSRISRLEKLLERKMAQANIVKSSATDSVTTQVNSRTESSINTHSPVNIQDAPISVKQNEESSGRFLGKIGIAAVLIGVAFFLKYAFDNNWIGPAGRVMIGIIFGLGFLGVGQFLRAKYIKYSDLIMGGGIAILYLSVFSAHSFYNLIDSGTTGVFMFVVTLLSFAISIVNATQTLALVSVIGAFATPFLVDANKDAMMSLFGYMTLINMGVLGISFFKKWPKLNVASFAGTVILFLSWFGTYYHEVVLFPTMLFVFVTFLIFLVANVARAIAVGVKADEADYVLLGANALALAIIGYILLYPMHNGILGFAAAFIAVVYIGVAFVVNKRNPTDTALNIFLPGLAVTFLSLAVPLQFSGPWIAVAWFVESAVLYAIASMISNRGFQVMGVVVYVLGLVDFIIWQVGHLSILNFTPIFNTAFMVLLLAIGVAYAIAYVYRRFGSIDVEIQRRGIMVFVIIANILSIYALSSQIIFYHDAKIDVIQKQYQISNFDSQRYNTGYDISGDRQKTDQAYYESVASTRNQSNTLVSILWTLYAAALTAIGFARRIASIRRLGLVLFVITAVKVVIDVWSLGQLYRIISFIVFGLIALVASFAYAKYKDRLKDIV